MTLKEQVLAAITTENCNEITNLTFELDQESNGTNYHTFKDLFIDIPGYTWESYISFDIEIEFDVQTGGGYDEPSWTETDTIGLKIENLTIMIDGLEIDKKKHEKFFLEVSVLVLEKANITIE